jgi:AraC-like DNA-binding protein
VGATADRVGRRSAGAAARPVVARVSSPIPAVGPGYAVDVRPWRTMAASHWHDCLEITYVFRGRGTYVLGQEALAFHDGDVFVIPAGVPHRTVDAPGSRHWNLTLYLRPEGVAWLGREAEGVVRRVALAAGRRRGADLGPSWEALFGELARLARNRLAPDHPLIATKLLEACLLVERCPPAAPGGAAPAPEAVGGRSLRHVREMLDLIETRGADRLTAAAVAARVGLNQHYASDLFRHAVGVPLARYIRARRLQRAYQLVGSTDSPFAEIARGCGFRDVSVFYRAFVKEFGKTPGAVRRLARGRAG